MLKEGGGWEKIAIEFGVKPGALMGIIEAKAIEGYTKNNVRIINA